MSTRPKRKTKVIKGWIYPDHFTKNPGFGLFWLRKSALTNPEKAIRATLTIELPKKGSK